MKVLVIGGSGLIGGEAALHMSALGHDVSIMSRPRSVTVTQTTALPSGAHAGA